MALRWLIHSACQAIGNPNDGVLISRENDVVKAPTRTTKKESSVSSIRVPIGYFQLPVHYPRYQKADYEKMEEWKIDLLLMEYGFVNFNSESLDYKRDFAIGAFLWPDQL